MAAFSIDTALETIQALAHALRKPDAVIVAQSRYRLTKRREHWAAVLHDPDESPKRKSHAAAIVAACDAALAPCAFTY